MADTPVNSMSRLTGNTIIPAEFLNQVKHELHERSLAEGRMVDLGILSGEEHGELWNSEGISLKTRIQKKEITSEQVEENISHLGEYFIPTTPGARKRCVDGSTSAGYDDTDPRLFSQPLGPQIQGGSLDEAVAQRLIKGFAPSEQAVTFLDDLRVVAANRPKASIYTEGGHTDDKVEADQQQTAVKTGCGALDGQTRKLQRYTEPETAAVISGTAASVLSLANIQPAPDSFENLQVRIAELASRPGYFQARPHDVLQVLKGLNPTGIEKVVRPHAEVSVTINFVPNTTFHRDHYNARTDSLIQNFNLDAWAIIEEYGEEYGYALVADAVATLMDLTDGSLRLLARLPHEQAVTAAS